MAETPETGFGFLFRTDRGRIDRATWWRGTLPLAGVAVLATVGWYLVRPYTQDALSQPPLLAVLAYLYLLAFAFTTLLLLICEYNLSAKRFFARGLPRALAAALPLTLLLAGALAWYVPRSDNQIPAWSPWVGLVAVAGVVVWNVVELGVRDGR